jgi:hypothetical protein
MISASELLVWGSVVFWASVALFPVVQRLKTRKAEREPSSLDDPETRRDLENFLRKHRVSGDANIRGGKVVRSPAAEEAPRLAAVVMNAIGEDTGRLYVRDPKTGTYRLLGGLDVEHLVDAASLMAGMEVENHGN